MQTIKITIEGAKKAPHWETLQGVIREITKEPEGKFTAINRGDGQCDYTALGNYGLTFIGDLEYAILFSVKAAAVTIEYDEVLRKHKYHTLNSIEADNSNATHQHESMRDELSALTILINRRGWAHRDHRGDECGFGVTPRELDEYLIKFHDSHADEPGTAYDWDDRHDDGYFEYHATFPNGWTGFIDGGEKSFHGMLIDDPGFVAGVRNANALILEEFEGSDWFGIALKIEAAYIKRTCSQDRT